MAGVGGNITIVVLIAFMTACSVADPAPRRPAVPHRTAVPTPDLCARLSPEAADKAADDKTQPCRVLEATADGLTVQFRGRTTGQGGESLSAVTVAYRLAAGTDELGFRSAGHEAQLSVRRRGVTVDVTHYTADPSRFQRATEGELARLVP